MLLISFKHIKLGTIIIIFNFLTKNYFVHLFNKAALCEFLLDLSKISYFIDGIQNFILIEDNQL